MLARAPGALLRTGTVARDVAEAPASEAPGLLILHPAYFAWREAGKKVKGNKRRRGIRKAPSDDDAIDGFTVLNETLRFVHPRQSHGQGRFNTDRITSQ